MSLGCVVTVTTTPNRTRSRRDSAQVNIETASHRNRADFVQHVSIIISEIDEDSNAMSEARNTHSSRDRARKTRSSK